MRIHFIILVVLLLVGCGSEEAADKPDSTDISGSAASVEEETPDGEDLSETSAQKEYKEIPCVRREYYLPPDSYREISFSQLLANDDSFSTWEVVDNPVEEQGITLSVIGIEAEAVSLDLWAIEQDPDDPVLSGVAAQWRNIWFFQSDESRYVFHIAGKSWSENLRMTEEEARKILEQVPNYGAALTNERLFLTRVAKDFYITTFTIGVEVPEGEGQRSMSGAKVRIERVDAEEENPSQGAKIAPSLGILVQRYSKTGNFVFSASTIDASCLEYE